VINFERISVEPITRNANPYLQIQDGPDHRRRLNLDTLSSDPKGEAPSNYATTVTILGRWLGGLQRVSLGLRRCLLLDEVSTAVSTDNLLSR
jgi:hypothetical protein